VITLDVCDLLHQVSVERAVKKAIDDTIEDGNEHAVYVCKDNRIISAVGTPEHISGEINNSMYSSCNNEVSLHFHTHPNGIAYPSINDLMADIYFNPEHDCVWGEIDNKIRCFKGKGEVAEIGKRIREVYNEWEVLYEKYKNSTGEERGKYAEQLKKIVNLYNYLKNKERYLITKEYNGKPPEDVTPSKPFSGQYVDIYVPNCPLDNILPKLIIPTEQ
jgi:proteasome lid subunit RPN8/RPN11